jgi:formylglycine-generating enzyme
MQIAKSIKILAAIVSVILFISCGENDESTNTPQGFIPPGMALIHADGQSFQMGSTTGSEDELPVHTVSFTHDFWMDSTEVTQGDYDSFMTESYIGYTSPSWHSPYGIGQEYPAYATNWGDAILYCNARSRLDGLDSVYTYSSINGTPGNMCELQGVVIDYAKSGYRLPTEAEWEYACRGGITADYYWGKDYNPYPATAADSTEINGYAVWSENSWVFGADASEFGTHPVASKTPNPYGLHDMVGNVFEWCNDWYGDYSSTAATDPTGPDSGEFHRLRGGSWGNDAFYLRSSNRAFANPDYIYYFIGFRVVLPVD